METAHQRERSAWSDLNILTFDHFASQRFAADWPLVLAAVVPLLLFQLDRSGLDSNAGFFAPHRSRLGMA